MSVDQVGSKDSDKNVRMSRGKKIQCPLIRLVPRTATRLVHFPFDALDDVSVDQVGSKDSDDWCGDDMNPMNSVR